MAEKPVAPATRFLYHHIMRFPLDHLLLLILRLTFSILLAFAVHRLARHVPLPARGHRLRFALIHIIAAASVITIGYFVSDGLNRLIIGVPTDGDPDEYAVIGTYLYIVIAGVSYAVEEKARAMRAEAAAARMQLGALRAQLHPHFLFNALHAVVQLIPIDPNRATEAAELVAELLRTTMEEERDLVLLDEEWRFVSRYIDLERIRFGERLRLRSEIPDQLLDVQVPSFALQTLVENAIRHGAAPRIEPTEIVVTATATARDITLTVRNTDDGSARNGDRPGTGLKRLQERLLALYGEEAQLRYGVQPDGVYESTIVLPHHAVATS